MYRQPWTSSRPVPRLLDLAYHVSAPHPPDERSSLEFVPLSARPGGSPPPLAHPGHLDRCRGRDLRDRRRPRRPVQRRLQPAELRVAAGIRPASRAIPRCLRHLGIRGLPRAQRPPRGPGRCRERRAGRGRRSAARRRGLEPVRNARRPVPRRHDRLRAGRLRRAGRRSGRRAVRGAPSDARGRPFARPGGGDRRRVRLVRDAAQHGFVRADRPRGRDDHPADRVRLRGRDGAADRHGGDRPRDRDRPHADPGGVRERAGVRHDPVVDDRPGCRDRLRLVHRHALPAEPARRHGAAARDRRLELHRGAGGRVLRDHGLDRPPGSVDLGDRVRRHDGDRRGDRRPGSGRRGRHAAPRVPRLRGQRHRQAERAPQAQDRGRARGHANHVDPVGSRGRATPVALLHRGGRDPARPRDPAVLDEARVPR